MELVAELGVGGRPGEERMPRAQHLVREAGERVVGLRANRPAEAVRALEHADAPALAREQRRGRQRVDAGADEDGVERRHAATLRTVPVPLTCHRYRCDRIGRMLLREVSYARPATVEEAVSLLTEHDGARALAGGQTLVNVMKQRAASPDVLVDLADLDELRAISVSGTTLEIGAMATLAAIMRSSEVEVSAADPGRDRRHRRRRPGAEPRDPRREHLRQRPDQPLSAAPRRARRVDDDPERRRRARRHRPRSSSSASSRPPSARVIC